MVLDLAVDPDYNPHYQWLAPGVSGTGTADNYYNSLWQQAQLINPDAFNIVKADIVPAITNGTRRNPTRTQLLKLISRVRQGQFDPNAPLEAAVATMLATRQQRWSVLAAHVGAAIPTEFRVYRWVHDITFCVSAARQFRDAAGQARELRFLHDEVSPWSLTRHGAMYARGTTWRHGVLHVADIPFDRTLADLLVDNSNFRKPYYQQAEILVTQKKDTIRTIADLAEVYVDQQLYTQQTLPQLSRAISAKGYPM